MTVNNGTEGQTVLPGGVEIGYPYLFIAERERERGRERGRERERERERERLKKSFVG